MAMLLAQTAAYLLLGFLADRKGHKRVLEIGGFVAVLTFTLCGVAPSAGWIYLVFAGMGIRAATDILSGLMIVLEFTDTRDRPTYVGLANTTTGIFTAIAPILGGWLATQFGYQPLFITAAAVSAVAFGLLRWRVDDPRSTRQ
jgi:MFS family permease